MVRQQGCPFRKSWPQYSADHQQSRGFLTTGTIQQIAASRKTITEGGSVEGVSHLVGEVCQRPLLRLQGSPDIPAAVGRIPAVMRRQPSTRICSTAPRSGPPSRRLWLPSPDDGAGRLSPRPRPRERHFKGELLAEQVKTYQTVSDRFRQRKTGAAVGAPFAFAEHRPLAADLRTTGMLALPLLDAVEQAGNTGTDLGPLAAQVGDVVLQIGALGVAFPQVSAGAR